MSTWDELFSPEEQAEVDAWMADAFTIAVEVPASKVTDAQLDGLWDAIADVVDAWQDAIPDRDWDAFLFGHGPVHRRQS